MERTETMKRIQYLVRISRDPHSDWGASVPDLPGCVATGKTLDSALRRIEQAMALHVRGLRDDGLSVPRPSHRTITPRRRPREIDFYATVEIAA
jgi:predicted RNase H-like HicB family nuclease